MERRGLLVAFYTLIAITLVVAVVLAYESRFEELSYIWVIPLGLAVVIWLGYFYTNKG